VEKFIWDSLEIKKRFSLEECSLEDVFENNLNKEISGDLIRNSLFEVGDFSKKGYFKNHISKFQKGGGGGKKKKIF